MCVAHFVLTSESRRPLPRSQGVAVSSTSMARGHHGARADVSGVVVEGGGERRSDRLSALYYTFLAKLQRSGASRKSPKQSVRKKKRKKTSLHRTLHYDCSKSVACLRGPGRVSVAVCCAEHFPPAALSNLAGALSSPHAHMPRTRDTTPQQHATRTFCCTPSPSSSKSCSIWCSLCRGLGPGMRVYTGCTWVPVCVGGLMPVWVDACVDG